MHLAVYVSAYATDRRVMLTIHINVLAYLKINILPSTPITQTNLLIMLEEKQAFIPGIIRKFKLLMLEWYVITDNT
jgi:hypothetical protein